MSWVELNECEQRMAKFLARSRYEAARKTGKPNNRIGPQSDHFTDLEGIAAEIAFCKLFNAYPDTQIGVLEDADAYTIQHGAVDVKATKYQTGKLLAVKGKVHHPADSYALMIGEFPRYRFAGWAKASELLRDENITDLGRGKGYALEQGDLRA